MRPQELCGITGKLAVHKCTHTIFAMEGSKLDTKIRNGVQPTSSEKKTLKISLSQIKFKTRFIYQFTGSPSITV